VLHTKEGVVRPRPLDAAAPNASERSSLIVFTGHGKAPPPALSGHCPEACTQVRLLSTWKELGAMMMIDDDGDDDGDDDDDDGDADDDDDDGE
jgi:hypothetical protein